MMNFVNHGTDEAILKSLNAETPDEELVKAMNKQGLVQKEVQVKGKHGVFTRKQWVRTGEAQSTGAGSTSTAEDKEPEGSSFPASVGKYLRGQGFKHYNPGQGDQHDKYESNKFTVYSLGGGKYEISGEVNSEYEEPRNVDLKTLKQMIGGSSEKSTNKKLIASAPDLTSEQIDSMKIEDVYDYMNDMAGGADSDGIACGTKDSDTYYQFTDSDDPEEMVCKTTVGAAAKGDLDSGKTMSIRGALKELCGY